MIKHNYSRRIYALGLAAVMGLSLFLPGCSASSSNPSSTITTAPVEDKAQKAALAVFDQLFSAPDYRALYAAAGIQDTAFENAETYAAYMEELVGSGKLSCVPSDGQYAVTAAGVTVATFTVAEKDGQWGLDQLNLSLDRSKYCTVLTAPDAKVCVNGVTLDESYVVQRIETVAEDYIPDTLDGYQAVIYRVDGLLVAPTVQVYDNAGQEVVVDGIDGMYSQDLSSGQPTQAEIDLLVSASKTYCRYMIGNLGKTYVQKYFDTESDAYYIMTHIDKWMQSYTGYRFVEPVITDFYRYSDNLYSARVEMSMFVTRKDGTEKEYPFHSTLLVEKQNGSWMVCEMYNLNLQQQVVQVRLDFVQDGQLVGTQMVDATANTVLTPSVQGQSGQFLGWYAPGEDAPLLIPDESGAATVPFGTTLAPVVLTARFDGQPATQAGEWDSYPDGIRIEQFSGTTFDASVMIIRDPSQVYMATSTENFSKDIPGLRINEAMEKEGAIAAINAGAFYDNGTSQLIVGSMPEGLVIAGGRVVWNKIQMGMPENGFVGFDSNNKLIVAHSMTASKAMELGIRDGCCFGPALIMDGQINEKVYSGNFSWNPRTAIGQRSDGAVIFLCIDGRQANSLGGTYKDIIDIMLAYGAVNACNLDGGSSSVMLYRDTYGRYGEAGQIQMINNYSVLQAEPRRMPNYFMVKPAEEN